MNRVIIINLNGNAYQLEESGYDALRAYLDLAARRLEGNPDKAEILADIEQAIADKFRSVLGVNKTVVVTKEVTEAISAMGPVDDGSANTPAPDSFSADTANAAKPTATEDKTKGESKTIHRLYRIEEGAMFNGVCTGLAPFLNMDVKTIRWVFFSLCIFYGLGAILYLVLSFVIPQANTPAEKSAAYGAAATAQEFIRRAKEGYYEGMKAFPDKQAWRDWKRRAKHDIRAWKRNVRQGVHEHAYRWQPWPTPPRPVVFGPSFGGAFFWLGNALVSIVALFTLYSLVTHHAVFGLALPVSVPLWIGIVAVIVLWHLVAWPLRALQWGACAADGWNRKCTGPFGAFGDFVGGVAFLTLVVWLLDRYVPQVHEALKLVPPLLHQMVDAMQRWLEKQ